MTGLADVATPALLLDRPRFEANCAAMKARARTLGAGLRPHMKTLKSITSARVAIDAAHGGIAVSTLKEAEYFAGHGIADVQLAVCITPDKLARALAIARRIPRFSVFVDSVEAAEALADAALRADAPLGAWIEVDCGQHRTGVDPDGEALAAIAARLPPTLLAGVATHGGHSYFERESEAIAAVAEQERRAVVTSAHRLRSYGFTVAGVSAGSTPTAVHARSGEGLSEIRPGVYMAGDLFQAAIGSMGEESIAVSVLATIISHGRDALQLDAGALALSKDRSTAALDGGGMGYGLVVDTAGSAAFGRLTVSGVNQEHGEVTIADPALFDRLPVGARVRVLPNHACMTTAMYDRYIVTEGAEPVGEWDKTGGW